MAINGDLIFSSGTHMTVGTFLTLVFFAGCAAIFLVLAKTVKTRSDNATFDHDSQRFYGYK
ncbi:hypothetical protein L2223_23380, partial [Xanthomonas perforans]|nr:hypothetical protein [Xanthomonas perforans]